MSTARYIIGDTRDVTASLPDASVDLVMTSPPFLALRSYLPPDHPDKWREIGSEPTPAEFLQTLLELTAEWRRVLAPHGSIAVELGDTYAGSGGAGGDYGPDGMRGGQEKFKGSALADRKNKVLRADGNRMQQGNGWPMDKSICGIPWLYALSLAYGRNMLTGEPSPAGQWRVRNVVAWCRPNPPVGALGDKYRPATSYMTIATVARDRYFDLDAVRGPYSPNSHDRVAKGTGKRANTVKTSPDGNRDTLAITNNDGAGAPPLDYWVISTAPYSGAHYATYPPDLCTRPILSMCPQRVCTVCGEPSRRIVETVNAVGHAVQRASHRKSPGGAGDGRSGVASINSAPEYAQRETLGWTECECPGGVDRWRNGVVLDPFGGSGTTGMVATGHGRDAILVDLDARNADLARERVGMFLTVEDARPEGAA